MDFTPAHFESTGSACVHGENIPFKVISEDMIFEDETGNAEASIFSFSYFRTDAEDPARPVAFFWNGGPGSSCVWLHTGMMSAWKMKYEDAVHPPVNPPFEMEDNPYWLLDVCDIVMIDPVGTGYSRLLNMEKTGDYYNALHDAKAIADFIERWLLKYHRRNSPIYLGGESYGTIRTPLVVEELMGGPMSLTGKMRGISVSGIFLLGTTFDIMAQRPLPLPREPMDLYTEAAIAWYHHPEGKKSLREHIDDAWNFGITEYMTDLFRLNALSAEEKQALAQKLSYFTDIDAEYFPEHDFRISLEAFRQNVGRKEGFDVGTYDGRYTMAHCESAGHHLDPVTDDPAMGAYTPSMTAAMNEILKQKLNITFDREYRAIQFIEINRYWNYEYRVEPRECVEKAARRNPGFRIFLGAGLYDMATTPGWARALVSQLHVQKEQLTYHEYESGHMAYLGEKTLRQLTGDMRSFITAHR